MPRILKAKKPDTSLVTRPKIRPATARFLFVGERRSNRAILMDVTWKDGRLAASTLFKALARIGIPHCQQQFINLWYDHGEIDHQCLRFARLAQPRVVAMGRKVQNELKRNGIRFIKMIHPAARGAIRKFDRYCAHVRESLGVSHA